MAVVRSAEAFTGVQSSGYAEDSVAEQNYTAVTGQLKLVVDLSVFRERAEQVLREDRQEAEDREKLKRFLDAWRKRGKGRWLTVRKKEGRGARI